MSGAPSLEDVQATMHRLFIDEAGAGLRKEELKKSRELAALFVHLARIKRGAHLVDAAAGKASVGFVAAELLPLERVTVLERDAARIATAREVMKRVRASVSVDLRRVDVGAEGAFPDEADAVVALHACGPAADAIIDAAVHARARQIFLVPCCYGAAVPFRAEADAKVVGLGFVADDVLRRRIGAALVDLERKLRLEAAGYETDIEEFVAPTVTPHNLLFVARRMLSDVRMARARTRLAALRSA